jgi:Asp/Glu/hydantoin racemase
MRIAFVHTVGFLADRFQALMKAQHPDADCFHIVNESLLKDLFRGENTATVYRRVVAQVMLAVDAGADLVVMTCSSTSPAVDIARALTTVPILKIDDPMADEAVRLGSRIAVICTNTSTPGPSQALLRAHAALQGKQVEIEPVIRPEAYQALASGDRAKHDAMVTSAAQDAAPRSDVLVLAQASIAHLQEELADKLGKPVLASPGLLMKEIGRRLAA